MANKGVKGLGCAILLLGTIGGILSAQQQSVPELKPFNDWENKLETEGNFLVYRAHKDEVMAYAKANFKASKIEGIKSVEGAWVYLVSNQEERSIAKGDAIKVKAYYTLTYPKDEGEGGRLIHDQVRMEPLRHLCIQPSTQVAYREEMTPSERQKIKALMEVVFSKDQVFWDIYGQKWKEGFEQWSNFLEQAPLLASKLQWDRETYQEAYSPILRDYSLSEEMVKVDLSQMNVQVMPNTTKNIHFFRIKFPVEVLREGYNRVYYNYDYLVGTSGNNIVSLKFIRQALMDSSSAQ